MTDSSNFRDIDPVCPLETTTAFCFNGNTLWVGDNNGKTWIADKTDGSTSKLFKLRDVLQLPLSEHIVKTFIPIREPNAMIIHYLTKGSNPGPVEIVHCGGLRIRFPQNALIVAATFSQISPKIALVLNKTISIYKFVGAALVFEHTIEANDIVTTCACCNDFLIFFDGAYQKYQFSSKEQTALPVLPVQTPHALAISPSSILCTYKESMIIYTIKQKDSRTIPYDSSYGIPTRFYANQNSLYMFYNQLFTRIDTNKSSQPQVFKFENAKTYGMIGSELLVISPKTWRVYGSIPPIKDLKNDILNGNKEKVYATFKSLPEDLCSSSIIGLFVALWPKYKTLSLELTKNFLWLGEIRLILKLFPQLKLDNTPEQKLPVADDDTVMITKNDFKKDIFMLLQETIEFMFDKMYKKDPESANVKCLADTLLQVYTINIETRKFSQFITKYSSIISYNRFEEFFTPLLQQKFKITPCVAVYFTHRGNTETAMNYWRELYDASPDDMYLSEASYTIREISESDKFINNLEWLKSKNINFVAKALLSTKHEQRVVLEFLNTNDALIPDARIEYYNFIVQQSEILPESTIVSSVFDNYVNILSEISNNTLNKNDIQFTDAYKKGLTGEELIKEVKAEINKKIIKLLTQHIDFIDYRRALSKINGDAFDKQIKLCIYKVTNNYMDGIKVILASQADDKIPFGEIQDFCRTSPSPPDAFNAALTLIPADQIFKSTCTFIKDNILYLDPVETIKHIPRDIDIKRVSDNIRVLFNLLTQRNEELDKQIAITKSLQVDAAFELVREQSKYVKIEKDTTCAFCKKPIYARNVFCVLPDGTLCHSNCKPKQYK